MRTVDRVQAGIDSPEVDQSPQRQMGHGTVWVGLGLHRLCRRHRRILGAVGERDDELRRGDVTQPPERDQGLCPDSRRRVCERRDEQARKRVVELGFAVGQGPKRELADGVVFSQFPQRCVRVRCRRAA